MVGAPTRAAVLGVAGAATTGWAAWWLLGEAVGHWRGAGTTVAIDQALIVLVSAAAATLAAWATVLLTHAAGTLVVDAVRGRGHTTRTGQAGRVAAGLLVAATLGTAPAAAAPPAPSPVVAVQAEPAPAVVVAVQAEPAPSAVMAAGTPADLPRSAPGTFVADPHNGAAPAMAEEGRERATVPLPGWTPTVEAGTASRAAVGEVGLVSTAPVTGHPGEDEIVVRRGDTLWAIAARELGEHATDQDVAEAWPRWYAANRDTIGEDPDLIRPGQRLLAPSAGDGR